MRNRASAALSGLRHSSGPRLPVDDGQPGLRAVHPQRFEFGEAGERIALFQHECDEAAAARIVGARVRGAERREELTQNLELDVAHRRMVDERRFAERLQPRLEFRRAGHRAGLRGFVEIRHRRDIDIHRVEIRP
jgi:hypothetical protein